MTNNFNACLKLLDPKIAKTLKLKDKLDIFFLDWNILPLFVQESYLSCYTGYQSSAAEIEKVANAAEFISMGDTIYDAIMDK